MGAFVRAGQSVNIVLRANRAMQMRWKPVVLAAAVSAFALFHSCKKLPDEILKDRQRTGWNDTVNWERKAPQGLKTAHAGPLADTIKAGTGKKDTAAIPYKQKTIVDADGCAQSRKAD